MKSDTNTKSTTKNTTRDYHLSIKDTMDGKKDQQTSIIPIRILEEKMDFSHLKEILSYGHYLEECERFQLTVFEKKQRAMEELKVRISYPLLVKNGYQEMVDVLLDYMSEIVSSNRTLSFQKETYDARTMGTQFFQLEYDDIEYVIEKYEEVTKETKIKNKKNYLIRMLVTAKSDCSLDYNSDVNYDMFHPKESGDDNGSI